MPPPSTPAPKKAAKKPTAVSKPSAVKNPDNTFSTKTQNSTTIKSRSPSRKGFFNLRRMLARILVVYLLYQYLMICPTLPSSDKTPTCQTFTYLESHRAEAFRQLEPYARPYIKRTQEKLDPYVERLVPIYNKARPVYDKLERLTVKYAKLSYTKGREHYVSHVHPRVVLASTQAYQAAQPYCDQAHAYYKKSVYPQWVIAESHATAWYTQNVQPHVQIVSKYASTVPTIVHPYFVKTKEVVIPATQRTLETLKPLGPASAQYYRDIVKPSAIKSYKVSKTTYVTHIHPRALHGLEALRAATLRFYSIYVHPQLEKIWAKIFEYKTKKAEKDATREHAATLTNVEDDLDDFIDELRSSVSQEKTAEAQQETAAEIGQEEEKSDEEIKAEVAEKRRRLEALRDRYEAEIEKLGQVERARLIGRLKNIRIETITDISTQVDAQIELLATNGQDLVAKLERYFARVSKEKDAPMSDRLADADLIQTRAKERVSSMSKKINEEIESYAEKHWEREQDAVLTSHASLKRLVSKAQEELGFGWTWQPDVKYVDWQRYHELARSEREWWAEYMAIQNGTLFDSSLPANLDAMSKLSTKKGEVEEKAEDIVNLIDLVHFEGTRKLRGDNVSLSSASSAPSEVSNSEDADVTAEPVASAASSDIAYKATTLDATDPQAENVIIMAAATPSKETSADTDMEESVSESSVVIIPEPPVTDSTEERSKSIDENVDNNSQAHEEQENHIDSPSETQVDQENSEPSFSLVSEPEKTSNSDFETAVIGGNEVDHEERTESSLVEETTSIPVHQDAHDEL